MCESEYPILNDLFDRYSAGAEPLPSAKSSFTDVIVIGHQLAVMGKNTAPDLRRGLEFAHARALENAHPYLREPN